MLVILCGKGDREVISGSQKKDRAHCIQRGIPSQQETDLPVGRATQTTVKLITVKLT